MKLFKYISLILILAFFQSTNPCLSQNNNTHSGATRFLIETLGSVATENQTPFWIVSNKYGRIPLEASNGYLRAGVFHSRSLWQNFRWSAAVEMVASTPRYKNVYLQQIYAEARYNNITLSIGSRENYNSIVDKELSSGDVVTSANARPIPEIDLSVPHYMPVPYTKGILHFKGNFAVGRSFDTDYLEQFINTEEYFTKNTLWHNKSLHFRLVDPHRQFPLTLTIGGRHYVQWGGTSTDPKIGVQPHSFTDFIRIVMGRSGGGEASLSDRINKLGNHYGNYDIKIGYLSPNFNIHLYKQHYFDDNSGMELYNYRDGLFGLQSEIHNFKWVNKVVLEYLCTRDQSGPIHHIVFDHSKYPGYGGGNDNYYNNGGYRTGVSYFNRSLGSPLLTSPEYNTGGVLGFLNNRIRTWHIGFSGYLSEQVAYRLLGSFMENWGTMGVPTLKKETSTSLAAKIVYCHPRMEGWLFTGEIATDHGDIYGNNFGLSISIIKKGILKRWD